MTEFDLSTREGRLETFWFSRPYQRYKTYN